jgi:hypothetical protein
MKEASMRRVYILLFASLCLVFIACGTTSRNVKFNEGYKCLAGTKIEVPPAINATGKNFEEIDVGKTLSEELVKALVNEGINADSSAPGNKLSLPCRITEYEPGDAFKRWLWPTYGSTVLNVNCELREAGKDNAVGTVEARHTVDAGGAYTIGAWKYIFTDLAKDLAKELKAKLPK